MENFYKITVRISPQIEFISIIVYMSLLNFITTNDLH